VPEPGCPGARGRADGEGALGLASSPRFGAPDTSDKLPSVTIRAELGPYIRERVRTLAVGSARAGNGGTRGNRVDRQPRLPAFANGIRSPALALAIAMAWAGPAGATPLDQGGAALLGVGRAVHVSHASRDVHVDAAPELHQGAARVVASGGGALVIDPTFDSSITDDPNSAVIEEMIYNAISVVESLFNDPITVSIRFRYSTTYANGTTPLPAVDISVSESVVYIRPWDAYISALTADVTTVNDVAANGTLPGSSFTPNILPSSANGRAIGLATPPVMFEDGSLGPGGPYDGIITINSRAAFDFTRPLADGMYDAQRLTEHEIDEVLGFGSSINLHDDLRPQDLFSWSAAGVRNLTSSGSRYFSIDGGDTSIVGFNQEPDGDFGDWLSGPCPQATPYVQNAFSCDSQTSDVTETSPESINLDVIGYDLIGTPTTVPTTTPTTSTTTTTLSCPPAQVECCPTDRPGCGVCGIDCGNGGCCPASLPVCDNANRRCIVCGALEVECCPVGQRGCGVCGTDCGNGACCPPTLPVCDNANGLCLANAPLGAECPSGQVPCNDAALGFTDVACCSQPAKKKQCAAACSQIVADCKASCATVNHRKKCKKRCSTVIVRHCRQSQPHTCS